MGELVFMKLHEYISYFGPWITGQLHITHDNFLTRRLCIWIVNRNRCFSITSNSYTMIYTLQNHLSFVRVSINGSKHWYLYVQLIKNEGVSFLQDMSRWSWCVISSDQNNIFEICNSLQNYKGTIHCYRVNNGTPAMALWRIWTHSVVVMNITGCHIFKGSTEFKKNFGDPQNILRSI